MQASSTHNPPLVLPLKPPAERKVPVRLVHTYPPERLLGVCMPVLQYKSSLATGYFPFMWCGALVHEGTLRFGSLCFSGCFGLMLQPCPWMTLWGGRARTPLPPSPSSRPPRWDRVGQMPPALVQTKRAPHMEARLLSLRSSSLYSSALKGVSVSLRQFLPQRSRFRRASASDSGAEVMAFKDGLGSEFKDLPPPPGLLICTHQTAFPFLTSWLTLAWCAPCMGISCVHCVIPIDPICPLVP